MSKFAGLLSVLSLVAALGSSSAFAQGDAQDPQVAPYPISTEVQTTRERVVIPEAPTPTETVLPYQVSKYAANGYGLWHFDGVHPTNSWEGLDGNRAG